MEISRRQALAAAASTVGLAGCVAPESGEAAYDGAGRLYTCGYDATVEALTDDGDEAGVAWRNPFFVGQTRDVMPDPDGNLLVCDDRGLFKFAQRQDDLVRRWHYREIEGSIRGITVDAAGDYYVGSWTADQGFHKVTETGDGRVRREWVYEWADDDGMITAAADPDGRLALALKTGEVHLIETEAGAPELRSRFRLGNDAIVREVLWDGRGNLYVAAEDHHLYKLRVGTEDDPTVEWTYDAGTILFGASVTPSGEVYLATNAGEVHALRDDGGTPRREWVYQHTDYEGEAPTDEYFWDGLVHQVATRPDTNDDAIYSCAYGENTIHKIEVSDGRPHRVWEHRGHEDNVREVRVRGEYVAPNQDLWRQVRP